MPVPPLFRLHPQGRSPLEGTHQSVTFSRNRPLARLAQRGITLAFTLIAGLSLGRTAHADPSRLDPEVGHNYGELENPRMTALGGATRASSNSISALYSNPANMALTQVYHVGAFAQIYPEARRQSYGGAIVDSLISSTGMAGGLGGVWTMQDRDGMDRQWMDLRFALAMPLGDIIAVGLGGRYLTLQQNGVGPLGSSYASGGIRGSNIIQTVTIDAGLTIRPVKEFKIALTGNNLTSLDTGLVPLMGGLGLGFDNEDFGVSADLTIESRTYKQFNMRARAGAELLLADMIILRAGYRFDQRLESHALSGGVGYVDQVFSVDASVRRSVVGPGYTAVVFGVTGHIESMGLGPTSPDSY